jgi:hypothetical protein
MRQLTANSRLGKYTRLSREKRKEELTDHLQGLTIYIAGGRSRQKRLQVLSMQFMTIANKWHRLSEASNAADFLAERKDISYNDEIGDQAPQRGN